jgi:hypothetical protein
MSNGYLDTTARRVLRLLVEERRYKYMNKKCRKVDKGWSSGFGLGVGLKLPTLKMKFDTKYHRSLRDGQIISPCPTRILTQL